MKLMPGAGGAGAITGLTAGRVALSATATTINDSATLLHDTTTGLSIKVAGSLTGLSVDGTVGANSGVTTQTFLANTAVIGVINATGSTFAGSSSIGSANQLVVQSSTTAGVRVECNAAGPVIFRTNGTERGRFNTAGLDVNCVYNAWPVTISTQTANQRLSIRPFVFGAAGVLLNFHNDADAATVPAELNASQYIINGGNVGMGPTAPTSPSAYLHLAAGAAAAGKAPLKLTAGTNLTTPSNGAFEYDGTNLYFTTGGVRKTVTLV